LSAVSLGPCFRCGGEGTERWEPLLAHGWTPICERCAVELQLEHARERAAQIPNLTKRLRELGGPVPEVICGYDFVGVSRAVGSFCELPKGHAGRHRLRKET